MRPNAEYNAALYLVELGLNDCQVSRAMGIPLATIGRWRREGRASATSPMDSCPRCGSPALDEERYAYLLGIYLGDGTVTALSRGRFRLEVSLDNRYPGIIDETAGAIQAVRGRPAALLMPSTWTVVYSYWNHWPCLFPQHGPGPKHQRAIELVPWQRAIVAEHPEPLLRGLIHSDGWRGTNRVVVRGKRYEYPRYQFCNESDDIRRIFCDACDRAGIAWRVMTRNTISIAQGPDVARMDGFVGLKS